MSKIITPNLVTYLRIYLIPVLLVFFYLPIKYNNYIVAFVFVLAALTDWLDGYLARKLQQFSSFGRFLDPVADKLLVVVSLVLLVSIHHSIFFIFPAIIIICREILISALREWMAEIGKNTHVAVSYLAKIKTTLQMTAITIFLSIPKSESFDIGKLLILGYIFLYLSVILTIWSMFIYLKASKKYLLES